MTTTLIVLGVVSLIGALVAWLRYSAKAEQRAADKAEAEKNAREVEERLNKKTGQPGDPEKTKRKFEDGTA